MSRRFPDRLGRRTLVLATIALVGALSGPMPRAASVAAQDATTSPAPPSVTVTGQARISVQPDAATFTVGVELEGTNLNDLLMQAGGQMEAVIAALEAGGVAEEDIQTVAIQIQPLTREDQPLPADTAIEPDATTPAAGDVPQRFRVTNLVQVQVRDLSQIGTLIETALAAGANTVFGVNFTVAEPETLVSLARTNAFLDALQAATDFATAAGLEVGQVVTINEEGVPPVAAVSREQAEFDVSVPIQPGTIEVTVTVRVTFELEAPEGA